MNSRNTLDFSRTNAQSLVTTANISGQPLTAFAVASFDTTGTDLTVFDGIGTNRCLMRRRTTNVLALYAGAYMDGAAMSTGATLASAVFYGSSSILSKDGGTTTTGNPSTGSLTNGLTIGNNATPATTYGMDGMIGELIFASGSLANGEREKVEGYLARQWGLLAALPETHTYKNTVPTSIGAVANSGASASDPESDPLTFAKVSGPAWLSVAADGTLSGTPTEVGTSPNSFVVSVSDGLAALVEATVHISVRSLYDAWSGSDFVGEFTDTASTSNPDGDGLTNLQEFAFGADPTLASHAPVSWAGTGNPAVPGVPVLHASGVGQFEARFMRRKDHGTAGSVNYHWQFTGDLVTWESSDTSPGWLVTPTVLAEDASGDYELVEVPFPALLDSSAEPRFFRIETKMP